MTISPPVNRSFTDDDVRTVADVAASHYVEVSSTVQSCPHSDKGYGQSNGQGVEQAAITTVPKRKDGQCHSVSGVGLTELKVLRLQPLDPRPHHLEVSSLGSPRANPNVALQRFFKYVRS